MGTDLDTPLARLLHQRGLVPLEALRDALTVARAERPDGTTLAARLVARGLLRPDVASALVGELQVGLAGTHVEPPPQATTTPASWEPGAVVSGYRIVRRVGQGGMGTVYEAEHLATGARRALKTLPLASEPELLLRFQREAELLARVDGHPNVVRVHAVTQALGRQVLVMDLLPGGDLAARLAKGPLAPVEVTELGVALARGLAHLHRHGVLHRDLKPHNVLFDERGAPLLADFGLARGVGTMSLTATGEVLGTPAYMSPEQARGDREAVGPTSDVYGLGAVLFHALTGEPPFAGTSFFQVLANVCEGPAPSPRARRSEVPPALDAVIRRALATSPDERYATTDALGLALEETLRAAPRPRRVGVAAAAVVATAIGAAGTALVLSRPTPPSTAPAELEPAQEALAQALVWDETVVRPWGLGLGGGARPSAADLVVRLAALAPAHERGQPGTAAEARSLASRWRACGELLGAPTKADEGPTASLVRALRTSHLDRAVAHLRDAAAAPPPEWPLVRAELLLRALSGGPAVASVMGGPAAADAPSTSTLPAAAVEAFARRKGAALRDDDVARRWAAGMLGWVDGGSREGLPIALLGRLLQEVAPATPEQEAAFIDGIRRHLRPAVDKGGAETLARALTLDASLRALVRDVPRWDLDEMAKERLARGVDAAHCVIAIAIGDTVVALSVLRRLEPELLTTVIAEPERSRAARLHPVVEERSPTPAQVLACLDAPVDDVATVFLAEVHLQLVLAVVERLIRPQADVPPEVVARATESAEAFRRLARTHPVSVRDLAEGLRGELELRGMLEGWAGAPQIMADLEHYLEEVPPDRDNWAEGTAIARFRCAERMTAHVQDELARDGASGQALADLAISLCERAAGSGFLGGESTSHARGVILRCLRLAGRKAEALALVGQHSDPGSWQHRVLAEEAVRVLAETQPERALEAARQAARMSTWSGSKEVIEGLIHELEGRVGAR